MAEEQAVQQEQIVQEAQPTTAQRSANVVLTINGEQVPPERVLDAIRQALGDIETAVTAEVGKVETDVSDVEQEAFDLWEQHGKAICFGVGALVGFVLKMVL